MEEAKAQPAHEGSALDEDSRTTRDNAPIGDGAGAPRDNPRALGDARLTREHARAGAESADIEIEDAAPGEEGEQVTVESPHSADQELPLAVEIVEPVDEHTLPTTDDGLSRGEAARATTVDTGSAVEEACRAGDQDRLPSDSRAREISRATRKGRIAREGTPSDGDSARPTGERPAAATSQAIGVPLAVPFSPGDVIADKYEVIKVIGSGGMGYVVSATHIELGHQVALKFLRPELLVHRDLVARFAKEARTAVMIKSEHVARVFDVGTLPDAGPFIAMELLEGQDLGRVVSERGPLPVEAAIDYILQACEALATAHSLGIVHRDIKPDNLFLSRSVPGVDVIKVLDFGISKLGVPEAPQPRRSRRPTVRSTAAVGSPTYMSPEQIRALEPVDARADVWALGCVLYELLCGAPAFDAPSLTQLAAKILERPPAPLRSIKPDLPPDLEWVVAHCLGKDPVKRFQNVGELAAALRPFAAPRSRIIADRCRYVLDPSTSFDAEELTGPVSWNGVNTGLGSSSSRLVPTPSTLRPMERATVVARRVVREPRRLAPLAAVAALGLILGIYRAVSSTGKASAISSQTFLAAPGRGSEPTVAEVLDVPEVAEPVAPDTAAIGGESMVMVPEPVATATAERQARPAPRVIPRRPAPPPRPKAPAPASSSTANEPDVGF